MNFVKFQMIAGIWFVGVPIGSARDITLRALDVLASADILVAEDSRSLRRLMDIHGVPLDGRRIEVMHDHSKTQTVQKLVDLAATHSVAYASEAGMPGIADPGFELARAAHAANVTVTCAPGPSAAITAIAVSGLPTDAFHFAGFLPSTGAARRKNLQALKDIPATLVLYESPKRIAAMLLDAADTFGGDRNAAVCRELTKKFETIRRGTLSALASAYASEKVKGELVVLIERPNKMEVSEIEIDQALEIELRDRSVRDAAGVVAETLNLPRRRVYQRALDLSRD